MHVFVRHSPVSDIPPFYPKDQRCTTEFARARTIAKYDFTMPLTVFNSGAGAYRRCSNFIFILDFIHHPVLGTPIQFADGVYYYVKADNSCHTFHTGVKQCTFD